MAENIYNLGTKERVRRLNYNSVIEADKKSGIMNPMAPYKQKDIFVPKLFSPAADIINGLTRTLGNIRPFKKTEAKAPNPTMKLAPTIMPKIPKATPTPTSKLIPNTISIPHKSGEGMFNVPQNVTEALMKTMDPIGEATNSARTLYHPWSQTFTPEEIKTIGRKNMTYGENPDFIIKNIDVPNDNGSIDRGLTRINSDTFNGMWNQQNPNGTYPWRDKMMEKGITSYADMEDLNKNIEMMRLILSRGNWDSNARKIKKNPSYRQWFAAPLELRTR
jgi:hypothetical protein